MLLLLQKFCSSMPCSLEQTSGAGCFLGSQDKDLFLLLLDACSILHGECVKNDPETD